jgi:hypothetical protein
MIELIGACRNTERKTNLESRDNVQKWRRRENHLGGKTPDQSEWSVMVIPDSIFQKPGKT